MSADSFKTCLPVCEPTVRVLSSAGGLSAGTPISPGERMMAYEAPKISVVGRFASTTLGNPNERLKYDGINYFHGIPVPDVFGPNGSR